MYAEQDFAIIDGMGTFGIFLVKTKTILLLMDTSNYLNNNSHTSFIMQLFYTSFLVYSLHLDNSTRC